MMKDKRILYSGLLSAIILLGIIFIFARNKVGNEPRDVVYKFLTAKTIEEKMEYVINKDVAKQYLDLKGEQSSIYEFNKNKFDYVLEQDNDYEEQSDNGYTRVKIFKNDNGGIYEDNIDIFYLLKENNEYKIDFEPVLRENESVLDEFLLSDSKETKEFKVYAKIDLYSNIKTQNKIKKAIKYDENIDGYLISEDNFNKIYPYYSITIKDPKSSVEIQAFMEKGNKASEYMINYLNTPGYKEVILDISILNENSNLNKAFKVEAIKSLNWGKVD